MRIYSKKRKIFPVWSDERRLVKTDLSLFKPISQKFPRGTLQEQIQFPKMCDTVTTNFAKYPRGSAARLSTKAASAREYSVGVGIIAETKVGMGQP